jgi:hypothetical protein
LYSLKHNRVVTKLNLNELVVQVDEVWLPISGSDSEEKLQLLSRSFCELLQDTTTIQHLSLCRTLSNIIHTELTIGLQTKTTIRHLNYEGNHIGPNNSIELSKALRHNKHLESLLSRNDIGDDGIIHFVDKIL